MSKIKTIYRGNDWAFRPDETLQFSFNQDLLNVYSVEERKRIIPYIFNSEGIQQNAHFSKEQQSYIRKIIKRDFINKAGMNLEELTTPKKITQNSATEILENNNVILIIPLQSIEPNSGISGTIIGRLKNLLHLQILKCCGTDLVLAPYNFWQPLNLKLAPLSFQTLENIRFALANLRFS